MLTQDELQQTLREHLQRRPYIPFRATLLNGDVFVVDDPGYVAHPGDYSCGGFISAAGQPYLIECGEVVEITIARKSAYLPHLPP